MRRSVRTAQAAAFNKQASRDMKVLAILYKGGEAAKQEPRLLGTVENEVSMCPHE